MPLSYSWTIWGFSEIFYTKSKYGSRQEAYSRKVLLGKAFSLATSLDSLAHRRADGWNFDNVSLIGDPGHVHIVGKMLVAKGH